LDTSCWCREADWGRVDGGLGGVVLVANVVSLILDVAEGDFGSSLFSTFTLEASSTSVKSNLIYHNFNPYVTLHHYVVDSYHL
jgi:hypothetical protein